MAQPGSFLGNTSCATSTCHGGVIGQGPPWSHSLSTWAANDPHAGAGLLLLDEDSRKIASRLDAAAANSDEAFHSVLRHRCISCHATVTPEQCEKTGLLDGAVLAAGVSCESCHGAAENWLDKHLEADFAGPKPFVEREVGKEFEPMNDTVTVVGRAETCVRCHVGSRTTDGLTRDMNHDLIAAGHPALRFDLLIYNENLPKHWGTQRDDEKRFNESAVRIRNVGRAINLAAAASLASQRASAHVSDHNSVPWPELADYDCFACHQSLSIREYRLPPTDKNGNKSPLHVSDGLPVWNAWHTVNQLDMRENRRALETLSPHKSDPENIARLGKQLAAKYRKVAAEKMAASLDPKAMLESPKKQLQEEPPVDWHQAAIQYLEIDAALRDLAKEEATAATAKQLLEQLRGSEQLLRFDQTRSESQFTRYHSPAKFDPDDFRVTVLKLLGAQPTTKPTATTNN